jgi:hypothetical protein
MSDESMLPEAISAAADVAAFAYQKFLDDPSRSTSTRKKYQRVLNRFFRWIEGKGLALRNVDGSALVAYAAEAACRFWQTPARSSPMRAACHRFDDWTASTRYGRTGQSGREEHCAGPTADEIRAVIRNRLQQRLFALRRIGVPYRLMSFSAAPGFDAAAWLPGEVMAKFFSNPG